MANVVAPAKMKCSKCGIKATGVSGHLGKKHKRCGGRKSGLPKTNCGTWERA